jgi:hypothetical protein
MSDCVVGRASFVYGVANILWQMGNLAERFAQALDVLGTVPRIPARSLGILHRLLVGLSLATRSAEAAGQKQQHAHGALMPKEREALKLC